MRYANETQFANINLFAINEPRYVGRWSRLCRRTVRDEVFADVELALAELDLRGPGLGS